MFIIRRLPDTTDSGLLAYSFFPTRYRGTFRNGSTKRIRSQRAVRFFVVAGWCGFCSAEKPEEIVGSAGPENGKTVASVRGAFSVVRFFLSEGRGKTDRRVGAFPLSGVTGRVGT